MKKRRPTEAIQAAILKAMAKPATMAEIMGASDSRRNVVARQLKELGAQRSKTKPFKWSLPEAPSAEKIRGAVKQLAANTEQWVFQLEGQANDPTRRAALNLAIDTLERIQLTQGAADKAFIQERLLLIRAAAR